MTREISFAEIKKHNNEKSVWIVIHNDVYDVTSYLGEHPGGEDALLEVAGKDGTQNFEDVGHSEDARNIMKKFKIGTLPPSERTGSSNITNCCKKTKKKISNYASAPKTQYKEPPSPKVERRIQSIVVPRERQPRGPPCERGQERPSSSPPRSNLKWAVLALAGAIVVGIVLKKYLS